MAGAEIKAKFDVSIFEKNKPDFRSLSPLPKGWRIKRISQNDPRIRRNDSNVIVLADQEGVRKRRRRVILIRKGKKLPQQSDNFREELLS